MSMLSRIGGAGGFDAIANTVERTGKNYDVIVPLADTVFTSMSGTNGDGETVNFFSSFGMSGVTFTAGVPLTIPNGSIVTNVELASGSVIAYKKYEQ